MLRQTVVIAGMHGAALAWTLLMGPHAATVELWPQQEGIWRCYEHFSQWAGLLYRCVLSLAAPAAFVGAFACRLFS